MATMLHRIPRILSMDLVDSIKSAVKRLLYPPTAEPTPSAGPEILPAPANSIIDNEIQQTKARIFLELVDLLDDVKRMRNGVAQKAEALDIVIQRLCQLIEFNGGTIINLSEWNPDLQRAVAVEKPEKGQKPRQIVRKGSSGLKIGERIIRKQEVVITEPGNEAIPCALKTEKNPPPETEKLAKQP
ncbi:MAG: hypothetical protein HY731_03795 [Candidatus Tectomicrobia bacterium]|nr:hypothetical protein [Candidatus Tectomicrobia bacterium]